MEFTFQIATGGLAVDYKARIGIVPQNIILKIFQFPYETFIGEDAYAILVSLTNYQTRCAEPIEDLYLLSALIKRYETMSEESQQAFKLFIF